MSVLREVRDAPGCDGTVYCSFCGEYMVDGGMWQGVSRVFVCPESKCSEKLLLLALDTAQAVQEKPPQYADWMRFSAVTYDRWEKHRKQHHPDEF